VWHFFTDAPFCLSSGKAKKIILILFILLAAAKLGEDGSDNLLLRVFFLTN